MAIKVTRAQADKVLTLALLLNSVTAVFSVILFFLSSWWIFLLLGTLGFPVLVGLVLLYRYTRFREPMKRYALNFIVGVYEGVVQKRGFLIKRIYRALCWFIPDDHFKHINWGYATLGSKPSMLPELEPADDERRFYLELYHYLATGMGNWNTLEGKRVLEVRSGGGGGLDFISRHLNPDKCIGVDNSSSQIEYCKQTYGYGPKMDFFVADPLEDLSKTEGLKDERIDLVLSLQSSKYVKDFKKVIEEINMVLKPGGIFSFTDLRLAEDWPQIERDLESTSMKILKKEDITSNVAQALKLDELAKWQIITQRLGSFVQATMKRLGVIKNNALSDSIARGSSVAMAFVLHKVPEANVEWQH